MPASDSLSVDDRKKLFQNSLVSGFCNNRGQSYTGSDNTEIEGAILNERRQNPLETEFTKADKFVISKLYAPDFEDQFREFMIREYSLLSYLKFINRNLMRVAGYAAFSLLLLAFLVLSFRTIFTKTFKINYLKSQILPNGFL